MMWAALGVIASIAAFGAGLGILEDSRRPIIRISGFGLVAAGALLFATVLVGVAG